MRECDKHPIDFMGLSPREFAKGITVTNYAYQKEFFNELNKEYLRQSIGDGERGNPKLSKGLKNLAEACKDVAIFIDSRYGGYRESLKNLNPKKLTGGFGFTNYFYQQECFRLMRDKMPYLFISISRSMMEVCNSCKNYMDNPWESRKL